MFERPELQEIVQGHKVAIVGNANSILGTEQGRVIDAFDRVIRINMRIPQKEEKGDVGERTDLVYSGDVMLQAEKAINNHYLEKLKFNMSHIMEFRKSGKMNGSPCHYKNIELMKSRLKYWNPMNLESPYNITCNTTGIFTTGVVCLCDVLMNGAKSVCLFGFDCFQTRDRYMKTVSNASMDAERTNIRKIRYVESRRLRILMEDTSLPIDGDVVLLHTLGIL